MVRSLNMVPVVDEELNGNGRIILWITFGLMVGSAIAFAAMGAMKTWKFRSHAVLSCAICSIAGAAYYALATNSGYADILVGDGRSGVSRAIFYARYIDWTFTTPLLLMDVLLIAGVPLGTVFWMIFCDINMVVLGLFGAVTVGKFKWGWFGLACGFQLLITYGLLVSGVKYARLRNSKLTTTYIMFAGFLALLWFGYPIVWGLAEGSNTITSDAEGGAYAGLDICAKVVFGWALMLSTKPLHTIQAEEEAASEFYVNPLETPCNDAWGNSGSHYAGNMHARKGRNELATGATAPTAGLAHATTTV